MSETVDELYAELLRRVQETRASADDPRLQVVINETRLEVIGALRRGLDALEKIDVSTSPPLRAAVAAEAAWIGVVIACMRGAQ